jgi:uncharacterized membrane protein
MENTVLKIVYTFFLGIMIALFVGFGIDTFYPEPEYPTELQYGYSKELTDADIKELDTAQQAYQDSIEAYSRNVSLISTVLAVALLGGSLLLERRNRVITNGLMLGGLFTLIYGVGRGFASGDSTTTFITVAVGLAVVVFLGFRRFAHHDEPGAPPPAATPRKTPKAPKAA